MVVYKNGFIRLLNIKNLTEINGSSRYNLYDNGAKKSIYTVNDKDQIDSVYLEPGEEITCGSFSPDNQFNFALGTSYGNIYIGHYVGEGVVSQKWTSTG